MRERARFHPNVDFHTVLGTALQQRRDIDVFYVAQLICQHLLCSRRNTCGNIVAGARTNAGEARPSCQGAGGGCLYPLYRRRHLGQLGQVLNPAYQRDHNQGDDHDGHQEQHNVPVVAVDAGIQRNQANEAEQKRTDKHAEGVPRYLVVHNQGRGAR